MSNLPPTSDKEFWIGEINQTEVGPLEVPKEHYLVQHGAYVICTSCSNRHTVPIDLDKYEVKDGTILLKDKKVVK